MSSKYFPAFKFFIIFLGFSNMFFLTLKVQNILNYSETGSHASLTVLPMNNAGFVPVAPHIRLSR